MSPLFRLARRFLAPTLLVLACTWGLAGCATRTAAVSNELLPFDQAIAVATDALVQQTGGLSALSAKLSQRTVVLDPTLDASTGQQTAATQQLDRELAARIARNPPGIAVLPFESSNLAQAQYLLAGTLARAANGYRVNLALVDLKSATVVAQSSALAAARSVDMSPLPYYRDSPVLVRDKVIDGYVATSGMPPGTRADPAYIERIASATVINDATMLYNAARYREALGQYRSALAMPAGDQIRALTGVYLSAVKLGQPAAAEEAFGRLVGFGIASNNLSVKFLFNPGSTEFWSDARVSTPYAMWVRQIAKQANAAKVCMEIVGHTSKTGTEAVNDSLSLRRANTIRQRLGAESTELAKRTRTQGMGARQTIVGSGTDDLVDAPDRRVEFAIVECERS
ncbi:MAG: FlgO family outer membrane protein [Variovorax sp.]